MAVGKNRKLGKSRKKKVSDPFLKKEWYTVQAPGPFKKRDAGTTLCTRTQGKKIASDSLKGRVFETCLADLQGNEDMAYRKIRLFAEDVQGDRVLTTFHGMDLTRDKLCSLIKKKQTLIEARVDVKTTDGYALRVFAIAFTKKRENQVKKTWYAQTAKVKAIRRTMVEEITEIVTKQDLKSLVAEFIPNTISEQLEKSCGRIFPIQNAFIRKVKVLKKPKFDLVRLMEIHNDSSDVGAKVDRENPTVEKTTMEGSGGRL